MQIDEAIRHCEEVAEQYEAYGIESQCYECAKEYRQLAEWLTDYKQIKQDYIELDKQYRELNEHFQSLPDWIPVWVSCEEAMPEDDKEVLFAFAISYPGYKKPKVKLGRHHTKDGKGWWTNYFGGFKDYEVGWWMPLPEPPKGE